jgi:hypothetical protein
MSSWLCSEWRAILRGQREGWRSFIPNGPPDFPFKLEQPTVDWLLNRCPCRKRTFALDWATPAFLSDFLLDLVSCLQKRFDNFLLASRAEPCSDGRYGEGRRRIAIGCLDPGRNRFRALDQPDFAHAIAPAPGVGDL